MIEKLRARLGTGSLAQLVGLLLLSYLVMGSYGLARPASESLFLETYTSKALPYVWLTVAVATALIVGIYNHFARTVNLLRLFGAATLVSALVLFVLLLGWQHGMRGTAYALYVWKDIYVIILVEIFWSFANAIFPIHTARWLYGVFLVVGSLGAVSANLAIRPLAHAFGTVATLWMVLPVFAVVLLGTLLLGMSAREHLPAPEAKERSSSLRESLEVLTKSRYLVLLLVLIAAVQVVITLVDFQYNQIIEQSFPLVDVRTGVIGQVYAAINTGSMILQALTGPVLRLLGVPLTLLGIPVILGAAVLSFIISPRFLSMAIAKVASKVFDYSLFRAAKEILYIPLSYAEKTQGKALIDMATYRVAKGGASLLIIALERLQLTRTVALFALGLIIVWWALSLRIVRRYRELVSRAEELSL